MLRHSSSVSAISNFVSSRVPAAENRYVGANQTRYVSPEFDLLVDRFESTIPWSARMDALRGVVGHMTENVVTMPIFYDVGATLVANRVSGVVKGTVVTDVERWDVR
jgi:ABC-type transport system substrate-binding protein